MSEQLRQVLRELAPADLRYAWNLCRSVWSFFQNGGERSLKVLDLIQNNTQLQGRHQQEDRCFILGNGPSIGKQDLSVLKGETIFACKFFNLHPDCMTIAPKYWAIYGTKFFDGNGHDSIDHRAWFEDISAKANDAEILTSLDVYPYIKRNGWFAHHKVWYLPPHYFYGSIDRKTGVKYEALKFSNVVPELMIRSAIYMGFKTIYLLGCDCDWTLGPISQNDFSSKISHFYQSNPFYNAPAIDEVSVEEHLSTLLVNIRAFSLVHEVAQRLDVKIVNLTPDTLLDVFPRSTIEEVCNV